jgi:hypothetical protein
MAAGAKADNRDMLIVAGIATVWVVTCAMAVALCVMARRADDDIALAYAAPAAAPAAELGWVATLAAPEPQADVIPLRPRAERRTTNV